VSSVEHDRYTFACTSRSTANAMSPVIFVGPAHDPCYVTTTVNWFVELRKMRSNMVTVSVRTAQFSVSGSGDVRT
jgi:hypothetical protein